jgi:adenylylsulfate kinase
MDDRGARTMTIQKAAHVYWHQGAITRNDRRRLNGHPGFTVWFTGLSGSGKSTLAVASEEALYERGFHTYILDGDNVRHGLNKDLGFSPADREENIRRLGEVAKILRDCAIVNLVAFISPYRKDRRMARSLSEDGSFVEVFVDCPVEVCEKRDPKGAYQKARQGIIKSFTGISAPYEPPEKPELHLRTDQLSVGECVHQIMSYLKASQYISC